MKEIKTLTKEQFIQQYILKRARREDSIYPGQLVNEAVALWESVEKYCRPDTSSKQQLEPGPE